MSTLRVIDLPPNAAPQGDDSILGGWWHETEEGRMICDLCPRACNLKPGDRGFCFVRENRDGEMVLTTYGKSTGFCIDPIEKKPLNHFYPGTSVLSFGTAGCNLGCKFCQNHDISKAREIELLSERALPETVARAAAELGCKSVAYTYNDPIIWAEYAIDTAKACREAGIQSVAVTAGYITEQARRPFFEYFDAANVDLKAFTEDFYKQVTLSHLQPVLDTLQWLKRETDIWFEITNLIIPNANDSDEELRQLCDWVVNHVGDEVPVHFSAFHPDFRMLDRPATPHETLLKAHQIARDTGIKYAYVGNVHDDQHQSTYCGACGKRVIQRDWYQLGEYQLEADQCRHCGGRVPGRFDSAPGDWGRKRQPVQIEQYAVHQETSSKGDVVIKTQANPPNELSSLTPEQEQAVLDAAGEFVAAAVTARDCELSDPLVAGIRDVIVHGVYVSLKRQGRLRGCCGFTGAESKLVEGIAYSARRTALEDPRLPPVSATELDYLELEVWLLKKLLAVTASGADREKEIRVGRDGLMVQRGKQRGLLLPGVATDHDWDEETFLRQVCIKAQLPPTAWREPDTMLQRFEGICVKGEFGSAAIRIAIEPIPTVVHRQSIEKLADFCRHNVRLISSGALPNYYLQGVDDGMVNGIVLSGRSTDGTMLYASRISLRPPMPLQSTLFNLCEELVGAARNHNQDPASMEIDLAVLEDPAMHGTTAQPDLRGVGAERCLFSLGPGQNTAWHFDRSQSAETNLEQLCQSLGLRSDQTASLFSLRAHATAPQKVINRIRPQLGPSRREPAVAGRFYPATAKALASQLRSLLPKRTHPPEAWRVGMVPHAGLPYSGKIAADVLSRIEPTSSIIVIGPKHTRHGVDWAVAPHETWALPGIELANDRALVDCLARNIPHLELDAAAHSAEHAIEVELPLLHHFAPQAKVVGIVVGSGNLDGCRQFASGLATALTQWGEDALLLISSDMNHFASDAETRRLDEMAISALETLDPETVYRTVRDNDISMCGLLPTVITLDALNQITPLETVVRAGYATSGDVTGDKSRVVGYAGMLFR